MRSDGRNNDLKTLGSRTFIIDCDVLQADGGTRTASITGAYNSFLELIDFSRRGISELLSTQIMFI